MGRYDCGDLVIKSINCIHCGTPLKWNEFKCDNNGGRTTLNLLDWKCPCCGKTGIRFGNLNETPEESLEALIRTGVCNPDGTPKEQIVTEVYY